MATSKALLTLQSAKCMNIGTKCFSTSTVRERRSYKLVVVGGGAGGCSTAAKFASKLKKGELAVIDPSEIHYYQPYWTLVGSGLKTVEKSGRPMGSVLPKNCEWIKDKAVAFDPENCTVTTSNGELIGYEYLIVAMGLQLNYHHIKGLPEAFDIDNTLCSNYSRATVVKTFPALQAFKRGNAIFTQPPSPIKCAGAPQKIMYMADAYFRKMGKRDQANIMFNTTLGVIFGVKKYAESLTRIVKDRNINVNYKRNLIEVKPDKKEAIFAVVGSETGETETFPYSLLHIVPPMSAPDPLRNAKKLVNETGFLDVNQHTLQHMKYPNVFGIGDCINAPTSKTAAAAATMCYPLSKNLWAVMKGKTTLKHEPVLHDWCNKGCASQSGVILQNLLAVINGATLTRQYDGYTSCPLLTGYGKCIMAEFDFAGEPLETFPFDQAKERLSMFHIKKDVLAPVYWYLMLPGWWNGPKFWRLLLHLGADTAVKPKQAPQQT